MAWVSLEALRRDYVHRFGVVASEPPELSRAAAKLAPYIHPRIGAVPVPNDKTAEYVIVVPPVIHASDEWVRAANQARLINAKLTNGNGSDE
jgi:hypothetical protein